MSFKAEQGHRLRAWRQYVGERRGHKLTLVEAAAMIAAVAEKRGIAANARKLPRTHASLTRWELGDVQHSVEGLAVIAEAWDVNAFDLMTKLPPS